mgnify:CR=1 FL=1
MEMLKKLKKRIVPLVLAVVIFATSVVSGPASMTAQAASVAVSPEMSVEFVMMLYNIFETISIASGIKDGLDDYDSGMSLFEAFIGFIDSLAYDPFERFAIYGPDGSVMTQEDMDALIEAAMGNGKLKVRPDKKAFAKYRIIDGTASPSQSPDPSSSPDPDDKYVNPFTDLQGMFVGANLVAAGADFLSSVQNNAVPEVDPAKYYGTAGLFDGYEMSSDGKYIIKGSVRNFRSSGDYAVYSFDTSVDYKIAAYVKNFDSLGHCELVSFYRYSSGIVSCRIPGTYYGYNAAGRLLSTASNNYISFSWYDDIPLLVSLNIPFFSSLSDVTNFFESDSFDSALNILPFDYHSMTAAAPDTLENLSGTKLDPAKVPAMNNAMKEAANGVEATGTDKEANNAEMIAAVKAAVAEALPEVQPEPDPQPSIAPDPLPTAAPDPDTGTGTYSGILGLILSAIQAIASQIWDYFSHPFGSIIEGITNIVKLLPKVNELVQALPASIFRFFQVPLDLITSGITNLYNGVLRIIELLPEQVQLVLGNIVSLPSAMLQAFADPLGAIQSLLGALPSWANLQGYLDKILDALVDPGSLLEPSNPGGEDPGGDGSGGGSKFNLLSLLNGLIYLIMILILLLKIFIHCLQFIINIFKIEASPGFLPDEMVMGLNFLKQIEITGIGLSIYDFMMGLVYILMVFGVVKLLRGYAYKIHIPSGGGK